MAKKERPVMCPYSFDFFDGWHWDMEFEVSEYYDDDDN